MAIFLCYVGKELAGNFEIGVRAKTWGVKEEYYKRIKKAEVGDTLVLAADGYFRSVHKIESPVFSDEALLWPTNNGSHYLRGYSRTRWHCKAHLVSADLDGRSTPCFHCKRCGTKAHKKGSLRWGRDLCAASHGRPRPFGAHPTA